MITELSAVLSQNELLTLLLGLLGAVFLLLNRPLLRRLPYSGLLLAAYLLLVAAWAAANAGSLFQADALGLLEHGCFLAASVLTALWCWTGLHMPQEAGP